MPCLTFFKLWSSAPKNCPIAWNPRQTPNILLDKFCSLPTSKLEITLKLEQLRALENNILLKTLKYDGKSHRGNDTPDDLVLIREHLAK